MTFQQDLYKVIRDAMEWFVWTSKRKEFLKSRDFYSIDNFQPLT